MQILRVNISTTIRIPGVAAQHGGAVRGLGLGSGGAGAAMGRQHGGGGAVGRAALAGSMGRRDKMNYPTIISTISFK